MTLTPEERAEDIITWTMPGTYRARLVEKIARHIREVEAAEREACARVADSFCLPENDVGRLDGRGDEAEAIAKAIRARGQQ